MKLNDEVVLESLNLEKADLSTKHPFLGTFDAEENTVKQTGSMRETRRIFSRPPALGRRKNDKENASPTLTDAGSNSNEQKEHKRRIVWVPVASINRDNFDLLQKFEGTVISVAGDSFVARLIDKTNFGIEEEAEIPLAEIMPGDYEMVKPGAVFYWAIGYRREVYGQVTRSSVIRFQRLPSWSAADLERAQKAAETFLSFLDLERANNPA